MNEVTAISVLMIAVAGDRWLGEPPNRFHPVAWMGHLIAFVRRHTPAAGNATRFCCGAMLVFGGAILIGTFGWWLEQFCLQIPVPLAVLAQAVVLKSTFAVRSLSGAATSVSRALRCDDVPEARCQVAYHLVSRDVSQLDASQLSAATIESVAENTSDSVIAPLFYFAIAGIPGALIYRFVNTCDAMLGYRTEELQWLGKPAARLDDLLNLVPSRITALLMLIAGAGRGRWRDATSVWWIDHRLTSSPNAGHPMSAAAGVLGVALEKKDHYLIGAGQPKPSVDTIEKSIRLLWITAFAGVALFIAILFGKGSA